MNKIIVYKNIINYDNSSILVDNNKIIFKKSGIYEIEYIDCDQINIEFILDDVDINILEYSFNNDIDVYNRYTIINGSLLVNKFYNNNNVNEKMIVDLCNCGSKFDYHFSNICKGYENYSIDINHKSKNTFSNISNKSIALNNSTLNFVINSNVCKDGVKSVLNQNTRIVTMGECNTKVEPNMFIDLDDVSARHGSVIGTFRSDQVFYLMSKGINYNDSLKLLIKGYILSNIMVNADIRKRILEIIDMYWG